EETKRFVVRSWSRKVLPKQEETQSFTVRSWSRNESVNILEQSYEKR
nr:hypothetical protein [Tanacetum cinerariifolium]